MLNNKVAIIGAGNLGKALVAGLLKKHILGPEQIIVTNRSMGKLGIMRDVFNVRTSTDNTDAVGFADIVILTPKPQDMKNAVEQIKSYLTPKHLIISTAVGISIQTLKRWLASETLPIVRVMPNTPARLGLAMSVWVHSPEVRENQIKIVEILLGALGWQIKIDDEELLHQVTAISGSGPAYIFYFAELLIESAQNIGLPPDIAKHLVLNMIFGAASMLDVNGESPSTLREAVTSKGGTTEAALHQFLSDQFDKVVKTGVVAAYNRSKEIGLQINQE